MFKFLLLSSIIAVKIAYLINIYLCYEAKKNHDLHESDKLRTTKLYLHTFFQLLMGTLMILLFKPSSSSKDVQVGKKEAFYLYVFGIFSLLESAQYLYTYIL